MPSNDAIANWRSSAAFAQDYHKFVTQVVDFNDRVKRRPDCRQFLLDIWKDLGFFHFEQAPDSEPDSRGTPAAIAGFKQMRSDWLDRIGVIHPQCVDLPKWLVAADEVITPALNAFDKPLRVTNMAIATRELQNHSTELATASLTLATTLVLDKQSLEKSNQRLLGDLQSQWEKVQDRLVVLRDADPRTWLHETKAWSRFAMYVGGLFILLQEASEAADTAFKALQHIGGYWAAIKDDLDSLIRSFEVELSDGSENRKTDLEVLRNSWTKLLSESRRLTA